MVIAILFYFVPTFADLEELSPSSFEPDMSPDRLYVVPENAEFQLTCNPPRGIPQVLQLIGKYYCVMYCIVLHEKNIQPTLFFILA